MDSEVVIEAGPESDPVYERCVASVFGIQELPLEDREEVLKLREPSVGYFSVPESLSNIVDQVKIIENEAFGENAYTTTRLTELFIDPDAVIVLLRDPANKNLINGYAIATPSLGAYKNRSERQGAEDTAYVEKTAILKKDRGHKLAGKVLQKMDETLLLRGYKYVERDAMIENGHAGNLLKNYADKIVGSPIEHGEQMHIRMGL